MGILSVVVRDFLEFTKYHFLAYSIWDVCDVVLKCSLGSILKIIPNFYIINTRFSWKFSLRDKVFDTQRYFFLRSQKNFYWSFFNNLLNSTFIILPCSLFCTAVHSFSVFIGKEAKFTRINIKMGIGSACRSNSCHWHIISSVRPVVRMQRARKV
jgi:hypothetical protein